MANEVQAPERIWAARGLYDPFLNMRHPAPIEYVRADTHAAALEERDAALRSRDEWKRGWYQLDQDTKAELQQAKAREAAALARIEALEKLRMDVATLCNGLLDPAMREKDLRLGLVMARDYLRAALGEGKP
jgi:hypothetical protein